MYYTIYKITNKLDDKFYIGKHKTKDLDDGYMGSGILIRRAIEKYGIDNFKKDILHIFETEVEMNEAEARLVVIGENSYNLCPGGQGGFNAHAHSPEASAKRSASVKKHMLENENRRTQLVSWTNINGNGMLGKKHSEEAKKKMSGSRGKYNVQKTGIKRGPYKKRV